MSNNADSEIKPARRLMAQLKGDFAAAYEELQQIAPLTDSELIRQGLIRLIEEARQEGCVKVRRLEAAA